MAKEIGNARMTPTIKKSTYRDNSYRIEIYELISEIHAT
jgi:hypothetical protein